MASPDPPWRRKTRPCPFYQQGRCMFADSCNFLHTVKAQTLPESETDRSRSDSAVAYLAAGHVARKKKRKSRLRPKLSVHPEVDTSSGSVRSPPRSPRLSGLLQALKDVIGEDEDGAADGSSSVLSPRSATPDGFPSFLEQYRNDSDSAYGSDEEVEDMLTLHDSSTSFNDASVTFVAGSVVDNAGASNVPFPSSNSSDNGVLTLYDSSISSSNASATFVADSMVNTGAPNDPLPSSNSNDDSISSEPDLLSPVYLSPAPHLTVFPTLCDDHGHREDSIDSGYADSWTGPVPFLTSPPRSPRPPSMLDLLASPFGAPSARVISPRLSAFVIRNSPVDDIVPGSEQPNVDSDLDSIKDIQLSGGGDAGNSGSSEHTEEDDATVTVGPTMPLPMSTPSAIFDIYGEDVMPEDPVLSPQPSGLVVPLQSEYEVMDSMVAMRPQSPSATILDSADSALLEEHLSQLQEDNADALNSLYTSYSAASPLPEWDLSRKDQATHKVCAVEDISADRAGQVIGDLSLGRFERRSLSSSSSERNLFTGQKMSFSQLDSTLASHEYSLHSDGSLTSDDFTTITPFPKLKLTSRTSSQSSKPLPSHVLASSSATGSPISSRASSPAVQLTNRVFTPPLLRGRSGTIKGTAARTERSSSSSSSSAVGPQSSTGTYPYQTNESDSEPSRKVPFGFRRSNSVRNPSRSSSNLSRHIAQKRANSQFRSSSFTSEVTEDHDLPQVGQSRGVSPASRGLKPLRLSTILGSGSLRSVSDPISSPTSSEHSSNNINGNSDLKRASSLSLASVSSSSSLSNNRLLSSARSSLIPAHIRNTLISSVDPLSSSPLHTDFGPDLPPLPVFIRDNDRPQFTPSDSSHSSHAWHPSHSRHPSFISDSAGTGSHLSEPDSMYATDKDNEDDHFDPFDETICRPLPATAPVTRPASSLRSPFRALSTVRPTLMFAIASDDVGQVERVLKSGDASPNEQVGPQSALEFALTNDQLVNKMEIAKTLLAYGANPSLIGSSSCSPVDTDLASSVPSDSRAQESSPTHPTLADLDPAMQYYLTRAAIAATQKTSALIRRSFFRPLARIRYDLIGQDCVLEQLFNVLYMHSEQLSVAPIVALLCGPSGHGKSLLARKFGSLLDVPTHTVNMTAIQSTQDLWRSYSMCPYEEQLTSSTLGDFLKENEGKRCVVVLDEIEKTADEKTLWSLLMPWELGRCSLEAGTRHIDVRKVIWLGTANIGHDLVFEFQDARQDIDATESMTPESYSELVSLLRPRVSARLGASLLSRVTTVLPFVPFSDEEKRAIAAEAIFKLASSKAVNLTRENREAMIECALKDYLPAEGARSLYRAISSQLVYVI